MLTSLSESVREVPNADALVDLVAGRVRDALHPESVRVYVREGTSGAFALAHPRGAEAAGAAPKALVERLAGMDHVLAFDEAERGPGGAVLAFAMRGRRELMGVVTLGPRLGDLPYGREDRELLRSVASQAGLSLENGGLIRRVAEQEKVAHELSIAAEVQRRLFPDRPPVSASLELAGVCVPAGDVGGTTTIFSSWVRDGSASRWPTWRARACPRPCSCPWSRPLSAARLRAATGSTRFAPP